MGNTRTGVSAGLVVSLLVLATLGLGGCREEEQGRPISLEKGEYAGKPDTPLTEEQLRALQQRGKLQQQ
jgi:hypothetical protein